MSLQAPSAPHISVWYESNVTAFRQMLLSLARDTSFVTDTGPLDEGDVLDQFGRLRIWGEQSGASRRWDARDSLDQKLRKDKDLHAVVLSILELLWSSLNEGMW